MLLFNLFIATVLATSVAKEPIELTFKDEVVTPSTKYSLGTLADSYLTLHPDKKTIQWHGAFLKPEQRVSKPLVVTEASEDSFKHPGLWENGWAGDVFALIKHKGRWELLQTNLMSENPKLYWTPIKLRAEPVDPFLFSHGRDGNNNEFIAITTHCLKSGLLASGLNLTDPKRLCIQLYKKESTLDYKFLRQIEITKEMGKLHSILLRGYHLIYVTDADCFQHGLGQGDTTKLGKLITKSRAHYSAFENMGSKYDVTWDENAIETSAILNRSVKSAANIKEWHPDATARAGNGHYLVVYPEGQATHVRIYFFNPN